MSVRPPAAPMPRSMLPSMKLGSGTTHLAAEQGGQPGRGRRGHRQAGRPGRRPGDAARGLQLPRPGRRLRRARRARTLGPSPSGAAIRPASTASTCTAAASPSGARAARGRRRAAPPGPRRPARRPRGAAAAPRVYNTSLVFDRQGDELARYSKIHLFDAVLPDGLEYKESAAFAPGDEVVGLRLRRRALRPGHLLRHPLSASCFMPWPTWGRRCSCCRRPSPSPPA